MSWKIVPDPVTWEGGQSALLAQALVRCADGDPAREAGIGLLLRTEQKIWAKALITCYRVCWHHGEEIDPLRLHVDWSAVVRMLDNLTTVAGDRKRLMLAASLADRAIPITLSRITDRVQSDSPSVAVDLRAAFAHALKLDGDARG